MFCTQPELEEACSAVLESISQVETQQRVPAQKKASQFTAKVTDKVGNADPSLTDQLYESLRTFESEHDALCAKDSCQSTINPCIVICDVRKQGQQVPSSSPAQHVPAR